MPIKVYEHLQYNAHHNWRLIERENCVVVVISSSSLLLLLLWGICEVSTQFSHFYIYVAALLMQSSLIFIQYSAKVVDIFRMISLCVWCDFLSWRESSWEWGLSFINLISYFTNTHTCVLFTLEISRGPFKLISLTNCAWHGPLTSVRFTFSQFRCAIKNNNFKGL